MPAELLEVGLTELLGFDTKERDPLGLSDCSLVPNVTLVPAAAVGSSGLTGLAPREKPPPTGLFELSDFAPKEKLLPAGFSAVSGLVPNEKPVDALLLEESDLLPNEKPSDAGVFSELSGLAPNENPPPSGFSALAFVPKEKAATAGFSPEV